MNITSPLSGLVDCYYYLPLKKKIYIGPVSASFCCVCHYSNVEYPRHCIRDRDEDWDLGLKKTSTSALKLTTAFLLLVLDLKMCMGIYFDEKQTRNYLY